ncbi:cytochrome P450 [Mycena rebaudengoi]|nr:cytochrome P450 [Mycena rebaudengoi]
MLSFPLLASSTLLLIYILIRSLVRPRKYRLPPGPTGLPILGNILNVPTSRQWLWFRELSRKFNSDIISLDLMGRTVIVLNSPCAAKELLDNRSAIYSDRPVLTMANDLIGFSWALSTMRYGRRWKVHRAALLKHLQPSATSFHHPFELEAARGLLQRLLDTQLGSKHIFGGHIVSTLYGIDATEADEYIEIAESAMHAFACAASGAYLVDSLPFLRHVPEFLPSAGFKKQGKEWNKSVSAMLVLPYQFVKDALAAGTAKSSIASRALEDIGDAEDAADKEEVLRNVLAVCYGGSDTTVSALGTLILAMVLNQDVQKTAQAAIDKVVGPERLPDFSDNIPYVDAIVREVLRWRPATPLAGVHAVTQDDVYKGYHIPSGSLVFGNSWAILHDEATYGPNTDRFIPERWLKDDGQLDPTKNQPDPAFGFGRRMCPGKDMVQRTLWITTASILATFNISKSVDENGVLINIPGEYTSGVICYPKPFKCNVQPRFETTKSLIQAAAAGQT